MNSFLCLSRASAPLRSSSIFFRALTTSTIAPSPAAAAGLKVSTPLPPKPKAKAALPVSAAPAGTALKGINYIKGKDDPVALAEEEYPEWLWKCLETEKGGLDGDVIEGDEFCTYNACLAP